MRARLFSLTKPANSRTGSPLVWQTGVVARTAMILTFLSTLAMPLQFEILVGVGVSMLLHVVQSSNRVDVVELLPVEGGGL